MSRILCLVLILAVVLPARTAGQAPARDLLHPPPFLEPSNLFLTFRPEHRGLALDALTVFDADIVPHFTLFGADSCRSPERRPSARGWSGTKQPCVSVTPAIHLRMENTDSAPIHSPSFIPRLNVQWLFYSRDGRATRHLGVHLGHHSNGQAGDLFVFSDANYEHVGAPVATDPVRVEPEEYGRLVNYLADGSVEPNTKDGNFSVNYIRVSWDTAWYEETEKAYAGRRLSLHLDYFINEWMDEPLRDGVYPMMAIRPEIGWAYSPAPLCQRQEFFLKGTLYVHSQERFDGGAQVEWGCVFSPQRGLGAFLRYGYGRDEYNSSFFLEKSHRIQFGLTVNRRRTFGADY